MRTRNLIPKSAYEGCRRTPVSTGTPEGLVVQEVQGNGYVDHRFIFPEAGAARQFNNIRLGVVVPIRGRKWLVFVNDHGEENIPEAKDFVVRFEELDSDIPDSPFKPWDEKAETKAFYEMALRSMAARREVGIETEKELAMGSDANTIRQYEAGELKLSPGAYAVFFGQPNFGQNTVIPELDGKCAMNLCTLNTGWGDMGNVNLMFNVDSEGVPCAVWFEASCS